MMEKPWRLDLTRLRRKWSVSSKWIAIGAATLLLSAAGLHYERTQYLQAHTHTLYEVMDNGRDLGYVSNPDVVRTYLKMRKDELSRQQPPKALDTGNLAFRPKKLLNGRPDDSGVLKQLSQTLPAYTPGVALTVNGTVVGYFADKDAANQVLDQFKSYKQDQIKKKQQQQVSILSAPSGPAVLSEQVESHDVGFAEQVKEAAVHLNPSQLSNPEEVLNKLETGGVPLHTYSVEAGDCLSCIASKLHIPTDRILQNNPGIHADTVLQIGQKLNITQYQPMLSLKTDEVVDEVQAIPYKSTYQDDSSLGIGYTKELKPGKNGKQAVTLAITRINGKTVSSKTLKTNVLEEPVAATILRGTSPVAGPFTSKSDYANRPKGNFLSWPLPRNYFITSPYGYRADPFNGSSAFHDGIDIGAPARTPIMAAAAGTVLVAGWYGGFGNCVIVDNGHSIHTLYGHMTTGTIQVKVGQHVKRGQILGRVGSTGRATGPHLHFGVYWHGRDVDPWQLLINR